MRRFSAFPAALAAGLTLVLAACSGETPSEPRPVPTPGGSCAVTISLPPGPITVPRSPSSSAIVFVSIPAQVKRNGQPLPDNSSVTFTIEAPGKFAENGLQTLTSRTQGGVASASPWSVSTGPAKVTASFDCATASVQVNFTCEGCDPFISNVSPNNGSTAGGDAITITGGHFTDFGPLSSVTFGGSRVSADAVTNTQINVHSPPHTSGTVDVCALFYSDAFSFCAPRAFTYRGSGGGTCNLDPSLFISSVSPNSGPASGGTTVTLSGGGFPTTVASASVAFGGVAAQVTAASATSITATSPQHVLANPTVPETVDITVTDLGSSTQRCTRLAGAFTYTPAALDPVIYSISPKTGPNDATTRVSIFGSGFQFPMQVLLTSNQCSGQQIEAPIAGTITQTQILASFPAAVGNYACLAGQLASVQVLNPVTGKSNTCQGCFKYYGCPTTITATPSVIPQLTSTLVTVTGNNFEEPIEATITVGGAPFRLTVVSVSSTSVVLQMPPLAAITGGGASCTSINGTLQLQSTGLACNPVSTSITYRAESPVVSSATPTNLAQVGGTVVTVLGSNFGGTMTVTLTKDGGAATTPVVATVANAGTLTFTMPFIPDGFFNRQNCVTGGSQMIPTAFGIRVTNTQNGCTGDLTGTLLVVTPTSTACTSALAISNTSLPNAVVCSAYSQAINATGGTGSYLNYTAAGLPTGLSVNASSGLISGTPVLAASGPGGSVPGSVTLGVQDTASATATKTLPILFSDPTGPFTVSGVSPQSVPATGNGPASAFSVGGGGGTGTISWTIVSGPAGLDIAPTGTTTNFTSAGLAPGTYSVTVRATDSLCAPPHTNTVTVTVNSP